jgi:hypothetical protein
MTYRIRDGFPKTNCAELWAKHRKLNRIGWSLFAGWIPYGIVIIQVFSRWLHAKDWLVFGALGLYAIGWVAVMNFVSAFRCPRCGSRFYAWGPWGMGHNSFARKCRNCGLRKWQCDGINSPHVQVDPY